MISAEVEESRTPVVRESEQAKSQRRLPVGITRQVAMTLVAFLLLIFFWRISPVFLTVGNLSDAALALTFVSLVATGMTFLFIVGEFDLSLGALFGFTAVMMAWMATHGLSAPLSFCLAVLIGGLVGAVNAFVTLVGIPSFIGTLGMLSVLQGATLIVAGSFPVTVPEEERSSVLTSLAGGFVGPLQAQLFWAGGVLLLCGAVLRLTRFGHHVYLVGGNVRAARQVGINIARTKAACFILAGLLAGLAGGLSSAWLHTAQPTAGGGDFLFLAVGAVMLGGVALTGGEGGLYGTFIGLVILAVLTNGLALSGVDPGFNILITGALIIIAGALDLGIRSGVLQVGRSFTGRTRR